jgi:hypothetical protein
VSSITTTRSAAGRNAASALSSVVLPVLVPPLIKIRNVDENHNVM